MHPLDQDVDAAERTTAPGVDDRRVIARAELHLVVLGQSAGDLRNQLELTDVGDGLSGTRRLLPRLRTGKGPGCAPGAGGVVHRTPRRSVSSTR
ncbi:hypothetical protein SDC9_130942 [bioreactor metagenome]|uniref:Uncharacterized protein n=1 Tax=bioreactor metagenome TaxID=1076179 RepID=A0A645D4A8_9ZZZZ